MRPPWLSALRLHLGCALRRGAAVHAVMLLGIVLSSFTLCWLLALRGGFVGAFAQAARDDQVVVLRRGSLGEIGSHIAPDTVHRLGALAHGSSGLSAPPRLSGEVLVVADVPTGAGPQSIGIRGVAEHRLADAGTLVLVAGRLPAAGARELVLGQALGRRLGLGAGDSLQVRHLRWRIVGLFRSGDAHESEAWGDVDSLRSNLRLMGLQSVLVRLGSADEALRFIDGVQRTPALGVVAWRQRDYLAHNGAAFPQTLARVAAVVGSVMLLVLGVSAANSLLVLGQRRHRINGLLVALGYEPAALAFALLLESLLLGLLGGLAGWCLAWLAFDGRGASTINWQAQQQVLFSYAVGPVLLLAALALGAGSALLGAGLAGWRLLRQPLTRSMAR